MDHAIQVARIKKAFEFIGSGQKTTTSCVKRAPLAGYTDKQWLDREVASVFKKYPLFMG